MLNIYFPAYPYTNKYKELSGLIMFMPPTPNLFIKIKRNTRFYENKLPLLHQLFYQCHLPQVVMGMLYYTVDIAVIGSVFFIGKIFP